MLLFKKITFKRSEGICCLSCLDVFDLVKSVPFCILLAVPCANRVSLMLRRLKHHLLYMLKRMICNTMSPSATLPL